MINQPKTKVTFNEVIFIIPKVLGKPLFCNFNNWHYEPFLSITWVLLWNTFCSTIKSTQAAFTCSKSTMKTSEQRVKSVQRLRKYFTTCPSVSILTFEQLSTSWVLRVSSTQHHTSNMGDFVKIFNSLNPLKFFTENCNTYRNLAKPVTTVKFFSSVKFIKNIFNNFNNIYYCFLPVFYHPWQ